MKKIIVLFKTHLDLGFTDMSRNIAQRYQEEYIPSALLVGEELQKMGCEEGFCWTIGSWLIDRYLKQSSREESLRMRKAIQNGTIRWHALPFTMHSEVASPELYDWGLGISKRLDKEFGFVTTAAKNTDVPGHTIAIVPHLVRAGVKLLHIGVNPASSVPEVPDLFRWKAPSGESIIVMYDKGDYGGFSLIPGTETAVYFAHTGDNRGPQSEKEILEIYHKLHREYPEALIRAGSLEDVAAAVLPISGQLPEITQEIGDTWIHGSGTDPAKVSQYRELLRLAKEMNPVIADRIYEGLLPVPEHTWGLDEKSFLKDHSHYIRSKFEKVRNQPNYRLMEASWQEQRNYVSDTIKSLPEEWRKRAEKAVSVWKREYPDLSQYDPVAANCAGEFHGKIGTWNVTFAPDGSIIHLSNEKKVIADSTHPLAQFQYKVFSETEVKAYGERYNRLKEEWALEDFGKIGLNKEMQYSRQFKIFCKEVYRRENEMIALLEAEPEAYETFGCPQKLLLRLQSQEKKLVFDFCWYGKPANRVPESCDLFFRPLWPLVSIEKMGIPVDPYQVVSKGAREMHATSGIIHFKGGDLESLDCVLLSVGKSGIYGFYNQIPQKDAGICLNLFNNQWGTNFPMWYEDDARFRFILTEKTAL